MKLKNKTLFFISLMAFAAAATIFVAAENVCAEGACGWWDEYSATYHGSASFGVGRVPSQNCYDVCENFATGKTYVEELAVEACEANMYAPPFTCESPCTPFEYSACVVSNPGELESWEALSGTECKCNYYAESSGAVFYGCSPPD